MVFQLVESNDWLEWASVFINTGLLIVGGLGVRAAFQGLDTWQHQRKTELAEEIYVQVESLSRVVRYIQMRGVQMSYAEMQQILITNKELFSKYDAISFRAELSLPIVKEEIDKLKEVIGTMITWLQLMENDKDKHQKSCQEYLTSPRREEEINNARNALKEKLISILK